MDAALRELVRRRASGRCEYCRLPQDAAPYFTFHVDHIRARLLLDMNEDERVIIRAQLLAEGSF